MNIVGINFACKDNYPQGRHWQLDSRTYRKIHFLEELAPKGLRYLQDHNSQDNGLKASTDGSSYQLV